jgi:hypothetical protein
MGEINIRLLKNLCPNIDGHFDLFIGFNCEWLLILISDVHVLQLFSEKDIVNFFVATLIPNVQL